MSLLVESALKVSLLMLAALAAVAVARRRSAALRHWILAASVACGLATPLLSMVVPAWTVIEGPAMSSPIEAPTMSTAGEAGVSRQASVPSPGRQSASVGARIPLGSLLVIVWLAGATLAIAVLLVGLGRLARLGRSGTPITDDRLIALGATVARAHGVHRPLTLLNADDRALLITWGLTRPTVMMPASASSWSDDRLRIVFSHELAHVRRADWVIQIAAEVLRSIYWFNPLVWVVCRRLRLESEHACDDAVLGLGVEGTAYAGHLLEVARAAGSRSWLPAPAMARPSSLERRVKAMLNGGVNRHPLTPGSRVATAIAATAVAMIIAGLGVAAQNAFATFSGAVFDTTNAVLPNTRLVLTHIPTQAKYEVRSDRTGQFEFVGLRPGDYTYQAILPGFSTLEGRLSLVVQNATQNLVLHVGSLEETVTVMDAPPTADGRRMVERRAPKRPAGVCNPNPASGNVGGNIRPPWKVRDVRPIYPANLRGTGIDGIVLLDTRIGTDGTVTDVQLVESPHRDLTDAAIEAVRQWEFDETLLNCVPQEVSMKVTVKFLVAPGAPPPPPPAARP